MQTRRSLILKRRIHLQYSDATPTDPPATDTIPKPWRQEVTRLQAWRRQRGGCDKGAAGEMPLWFGRSRTGEGQRVSFQNNPKKQSGIKTKKRGSLSQFCYGRGVEGRGSVYCFIVEPEIRCDMIAKGAATASRPPPPPPCPEGTFCSEKTIFQNRDVRSKESTHLGD